MMILAEFYLKKIVLYMFLISLAGCVGTIQDNSQKVEGATTADVISINFAGVEMASAIAHDKIRLSFFPASGGSNQFDYRVFINGSTKAASSTSSSSLQPDGRGYLHVIVRGLSVGTSYSFSVKAFDKKNNVQDKNTKDISLSTLSYLVPQFDGISSLENLPGIDGESKLLAIWGAASEAAPNPNPFGVNPYAITGYRVFVGQSEESLQLVATIPNPNATQYEISNLSAGVNYLVRVRAIDSRTPPIEDLNLTTRELKTLTNKPIQFAGLKTLTIPTDSSGFSTLNLSWDPGEGSFDRYFIYYSTTPKSSFDPSETPAKIITTMSTTSTTLTVPLPHQTYYVAVVACNGAACSDFRGNTTVRSVKTTPPIALFNGIESITLPSGVLGTTALDLHWSLPDTTKGVYNEIRIFRTDGNGTYNPNTDRIFAFNPASPNVAGFDTNYSSLSSPITQSARIRGLTTDQEYCFVIKAFSTNPVDPLNPTGSTHMNERKVCATPRFVVPGFNGLKTSCAAVTATSFRVSWDLPEPAGIYEYFKVWVKSAGSPFIFTQAQTGDNQYTEWFAPSNATSATISGLAPNTTYQIGARTYASMSPFYDNNNSVINCSTASATVRFSGWMDVMALGPKINGLTGQPIRERITEALPAGGAIDSVYTLPYPQEYPSGTSSDSSTQGMIRLQWADVELPGIGFLSDFSFDANGEPLNNGNGYNIYRMSWTASHDSVRPTVTSSGWGAPLNGLVPISPRLGGEGNFGEFVDYTVDRSSLAANETRIYWYKIEAVMNNLPVSYGSLVGDEVIKVILPGNNGALVHRWIVNRDICKSMDKNPDRSNNYTCSFTGLASVNNRYDIEKHLIYDRFPLGCNFTRGTASNKCSSGNASFEGTGANGTTNGDCVSNHAGATTTQDLTGTVTGGPLAVLMNRNIGQCFINPGATSSATEWKTVNGLDFGVSDLSTRIPLNSATYPNGEGLGTIIASNNAKLPSLASRLSGSQSARLCQAFTIRHRGANIIKRKPRLHEHFAAASPSPHQNQPHRIYSGGLQTATPDRDCTGSSTKGNTGIATINYLNNSWPLSGSADGAKIPAMITGSAQDVSNQISTEACVSRYGIQDVLGIRHSIQTASTMWCDYGLNRCSAGFTDLINNPPTVSYTPPVDLEAKNYLRNAFGFLTLAPSAENSFLVMGSSLNPTIAGNYTSLSTGLLMSCTDANCNGSDDFLATAQANDISGLASIEGLSFDGGAPASFPSTFSLNTSAQATTHYGISFRTDSRFAHTISRPFDSNGTTSFIAQTTLCLGEIDESN
jgi:hypothetical protein